MSSQIEKEEFRSSVSKGEGQRSETRLESLMMNTGTIDDVGDEYIDDIYLTEGLQEFS